MHPVIKKAARTLDANPHFELLARFGYITNGIIHGLIGLAAIGIALGRGGEADQSGTLKPLEHSSIGLALVAVVAVGLIALGIWQFVHAVLVRHTQPTHRWLRRASAGLKGVTYVFLGITTASFLFQQTDKASSAGSSERAASDILSMPGGETILSIVGIVVALIGAGFIYRGVSRHFLDHVKRPKGVLGTVIVALGVIGYVAKGITIVSLGVVVTNAALTVDITKARGLDSALKSYLSLPLGSFLLFAIGLGFLAYALYSAARSRLTTE